MCNWIFIFKLAGCDYLQKKYLRRRSFVRNASSGTQVEDSFSYVLFSVLPTLSVREKSSFILLLFYVTSSFIWDFFRSSTEIIFWAQKLERPLKMSERIFCSKHSYHPISSFVDTHLIWRDKGLFHKQKLFFLCTKIIAFLCCRAKNSFSVILNHWTRTVRSNRKSLLGL